MLRKAGPERIDWKDEKEPGRTERTPRERRPAPVFCLGHLACTWEGPDFTGLVTPDSGRPQSFHPWDEENVGVYSSVRPASTPRNTHDRVVSGSHIFNTRSTPQARDYVFIDMNTGDFLITSDDSNMQTGMRALKPLHWFPINQHAPMPSVKPINWCP